MARHILINLDELITRELDLAAREFSNVEIKNNVSYQDFNQYRMNHLQDLFDQAADVMHDLDVKTLTGDVAEILKSKKNIMNSFSAYQVLKSGIEKAVNRNKEEMVLERKIEEPMESSAVESAEETPVEDTSADDNYLIQILEAEKQQALEEEKLAEKAKTNKLRQEAYKKQLENNKREIELREQQDREAQARFERENKIYREQMEKWNNEYNQQIPPPTEPVYPVSNTEEYLKKQTEYQNQLAKLEREELLIKDEAVKIGILEEINNDIYYNSSFVENNYNDSYDKYVHDEYEKYRIVEQQRLEEARRYGLHINERSSFTVTDLETARFREEQEALLEKERQERVRAEQERANQYYREKQRQVEEYVSFGKGHLDLSSDLQKKSGSEPVVFDSSYDFSANYSYTPSSTETTGDFLVRKSFDSYELDKYSALSSNADIFNTISSQATEYASRNSKYIVPEIYAHAMRRNVEAAHDHWKSVKDTPEELDAIKKYNEERNAFEQFKSDFKTNDYKLERADKGTATSFTSFDDGRPVDKSHVFYKYTPDGIVTGGSSDTNKTSGRHFRADKERTNEIFHYTKENPLVVSPEYKKFIYSKGQEAQNTLDNLVKVGKEWKYSDKQKEFTVSRSTTNELKTNLDAFHAFKKAENAGVVVVSATSENKRPNLRDWSMRTDIRYNTTSRTSYYNKKAEQPSGDATVGGTGGNGPNAKNTAGPESSTGKRPTSKVLFDNLYRNKSESKTKQGTEFKHRHLTKRQFQDAFYHSKGYVGRASRVLGRAMVQTAEAGDDNALHTLDNGKYYTVATLKAVRGISGHHVVNSQKESLRLDRLKNQADKIGKLDADLIKNQQVKAKVAKELEEKYKHGISHKKIKSEIELRRETFKYNELKKYGTISKKSTKQIDEIILKLQYNSTDLKKQIKHLESLGSKLTTAQRKQLVKLLKRKEQTDKYVRRYISLRKGRDAFADQIAAMSELGDKARGISGDLSSGAHALLGFISKPFTQGDVLAADGLYNAATLLANRHTRSVLKKMYSLASRTGRFAGRTILDTAYVLSGNDPNLWRYALESEKLKIAQAKKAGKELTKKSVNLAKKKAIKTAKKAKQGLKDRTPKKIKSTYGSVKRNVDKISGSIRSRYERSLTYKGVQGVKGVFGAIGDKFFLFKENIKALLGKLLALKAKIVSLLLSAGTTVFFVIIGLTVIFFLFGLFSSALSVIGSPYEDGDKLDLSPYVEILDEKQFEFDGEINEIMANTEENGGDYRRIFITYATPITNNYKEILSMMAVRLQQELDIEKNPEVKEYLESLYDDSHYYTTIESEPYACSGCVTRDYKCTDALDEFVSTERKNRHNSYSARGGCIEYTYSCGHCRTEEHGRGVEKPCSNSIPGIGEYICQHRWCPGDHIGYKCNGHTETICYGEHIDLDVTINILGFDDIFTADTMGNDGFNGVAGKKIGNFKITYYCVEPYSHICNDGSPDSTATGTKPTPGRTIAVDPTVIPLGSHVIIDGHEYIAEDTGGAIKGKRIDIVVKTHQEALNKGKRSNVPVYTVSYSGGSVQDTGKWEGWTDSNIDWCKVIYDQDWDNIYSGVNFTSGGSGTPLTNQEIEELLKNVPDFDSLPAARQNIINTAYSLIGNIPYGWGQAATGPGFAGINFKKGLDCSHFVDWVYWTAVGDNLGNGSTATLSTGGKFVKIDKKDLLPGDLGFKWTGGSTSSSNANHVGIYTGSSKGLWVHCTGGAGVVQNNYGGFTVFYRYIGF